LSQLPSGRNHVHGTAGDFAQRRFFRCCAKMEPASKSSDVLEPAKIGLAGTQPKRRSSSMQIEQRLHLSELAAIGKQRFRPAAPHAGKRGNYVSISASPSPWLIHPMPDESSTKLNKIGLSGVRSWTIGWSITVATPTQTSSETPNKMANRPIKRAITGSQVRETNGLLRVRSAGRAKMLRGSFALREEGRRQFFRKQNKPRRPYGLRGSLLSPGVIGNAML